MNHISGFELYMQSLAIGFMVVICCGMRAWLDIDTHPPQYILVRSQCFAYLV